MSQKDTTIISKKIQLAIVDVPRVFISRSNFSIERSIVFLSITIFVILFFINLERRDVNRIFATLFELANNDKNTRATINILVEKTIYSYLIELELKNLILFSKNFFQISFIIAISKKNIQRIVDRALNNYVQRYSF